MSMEIWHWVQEALMVLGLASVFLAAPLSLAFGWIGWIQTDRHSGNGWRTKALYLALLLVSVAAGLYLVAFALQWWTQGHELHTQKIVLDWICIAGAVCCSLGLLISAFGKGRTRIPIACAGFFSLFLFLQSTPLAWLP